MLHSRQIEAFRNVMISGGITSAARMMNITQPAVSRLIRELEITLDMKLFERIGLTVKPTEKATLFFAEVEKSFLGMNHILRYALSLHERSERSINICAIATLAAGYLPRFLSGFCAEREDVTLSLSGLPAVQIAEAITSGAYDIGFAAMPIEHSGIAVIRLPPLPFLAVLPIDHPLTAKSVLHPEDFEGQPFISHGRTTLVRVKIDTLFARHGVTRRMRVESSVSSSICSMVCAGTGLALVDPYSAIEFEDRSAVIRAFLPRIEAEYAIVYSTQRALPEYVRSMIDQFHCHTLALAQSYY